MQISAAGADVLHEDGRTVRETDRYDKANTRFPQISLTRLKTGFSGGRGVSACVCVCLDVRAHFKILPI